MDNNVDLDKDHINSKYFRSMRVNVTKKVLSFDKIVFECPKCGALISLHYFGGELDSATHCGLVFSLKTPTILLAIEKDR